MSKDRKNYSKYDGVSRKLKQIEKSDSEEETFQLGENRSESGKVSEE